METHSDVQIKRLWDRMPCCLPRFTFILRPLPGRVHPTEEQRGISVTRPSKGGNMLIIPGLAKLPCVNGYPISSVRWVLEQKFSGKHRSNENAQETPAGFRFSKYWDKSEERLSLMEAMPSVLWFSSCWHDCRYCCFGNAHREGIDFDRLSWIICVPSYPF